MPLEVLAIRQARTNRIASYNSYRRAFGMEAATTFKQISNRQEVIDVLTDLYDDPDDVEFYPGLFAEDRVPNSPLPGLLLRMVAVDAFSQALTNPLLSEHVYNEETFSLWGFEVIQQTGSLAAILARNVPVRGNLPIIMTQAAWQMNQEEPTGSAGPALPFETGTGNNTGSSG